MAREAVDTHHMTRPEFRDLFSNIFDKPLSRTASEKRVDAEKIRDRVLHGKSVSEADQRRAVVDLLEYAEAFNCEVYDLAGFRPFGPLRGVKGATSSLDKRTSRWIDGKRLFQEQWIAAMTWLVAVMNKSGIAIAARFS